MIRFLILLIVSMIHSRLFSAGEYLTKAALRLQMKIIPISGAPIITNGVKNVYILVRLRFTSLTIATSNKRPR